MNPEKYATESVASPSDHSLMLKEQKNPHIYFCIQKHKFILLQHKKWKINVLRRCVNLANVSLIRQAYKNEEKHILTHGAHNVYKWSVRDIQFLFDYFSWQPYFCLFL